MAETDSDHLVNAQLDLIGIVDENPSSKKEDEGADEQCWSLVPVQDEKVSFVFLPGKSVDPDEIME